MTETSTNGSKAVDLQWLRDYFAVKDEKAQCHCGKIVFRTYDGECLNCHRTRFAKLGRPACPEGV